MNAAKTRRPSIIRRFLVGGLVGLAIGACFMLLQGIGPFFASPMQSDKPVVSSDDEDKGPATPRSQVVGHTLFGSDIPREQQIQGQRFSEVLEQLPNGEVVSRRVPEQINIMTSTDRFRSDADVTIWTRIARRQLVTGDVDGAFQTVAAIPTDDERSATLIVLLETVLPIIRAGFDEAIYVTPLTESVPADAESDTSQDDSTTPQPITPQVLDRVRDAAQTIQDPLARANVYVALADVQIENGDRAAHATLRESLQAARMKQPYYSKVVKWFSLIRWPVVLGMLGSIVSVVAQPTLEGLGASLAIAVGLKKNDDEEGEKAKSDGSKQSGNENSKSKK